MRLATKKQQSTKGRLLSESKVRRVLSAMNVDAEKFMRLYAADSSRAPRGSRPPSSSQITAVKRWMKDRDYGGLKQALGTRNATTVDSVIRRVLEHSR